MSSSNSHLFGRRHGRPGGARPSRLFRPANDNVERSAHQPKTHPARAIIQVEMVKTSEVGPIMAMIGLLAFAAYVELSAVAPLVAATIDGLSLGSVSF